MTFSIFVVSFGLCALMVGARLLEIKRKKVFAVTELLNTFNDLFEIKFAQLKQFLHTKKQETIFFITHHVPFHIWNTTRDMTSGLRKRYEKIERTVRGRNMIKQTGEASEFIKKISRDK